MSESESPLLCPVCGEHLAPAGRALQCVNAHSFDLAQEGYVNLLLADSRPPKVRGDTREMLLARRRFLERGHYAPLSEALAAQAYAHLAPHVGHGDLHVVDAGCGEGHHLGQVQRHVEARLGPEAVCFWGMDSAKEAIRLAARRYPRIRFFVADINRRIPLAARSVHMLLNVFAPRNRAEFDRVVAPNGALLVVIPAPEHLMPLRAELGLLGIEAGKREHVIAQFAGAFRPVDERHIEYDLALGGGELRDLVAMTPSYWHMPPEALAALAGRQDVHVRVAFELLLFAR